MTKKNNRVFCIADIHGYLKALEQVLERLKLQENDEFIFLGDYVDRGPQSAQVVQRLIELSQTNKCIFIRGNHDSWAKDFLIKGTKNKIWIANGGDSTIKSYVESGLIVNKKHEEFFKNLINFYVDEYNRGFVHGGFHSRLGLGYEPFESNYYWDRDMWNFACVYHKKEETGNSVTLRFRKHKEIYIGHTPTINWNNLNNKPINVPMLRCNVWNIDTGMAYKGGKLTAININTKEFFQSDLLEELYAKKH